MNADLQHSFPSLPPRKRQLSCQLAEAMAPARGGLNRTNIIYIKTHQCNLYGLSFEENIFLLVFLEQTRAKSENLCPMQWELIEIKP